MKIEKIENGWTIEVCKNHVPSSDNDFQAYEYKTYAFTDWNEAVKFIKDNQELI